MSEDFPWRCKLCDAPTTDNLRGKLGNSGFDGFEHVHRACWDAWAGRDVETLTRRRKEACEAGHHRSPGRWTRDPADPYGDAAYWECTRGCGHVQQHPGYGINRGIWRWLAGRYADMFAEVIA